MPKIIFHIDVNNAFLSWSAIDLLKKGHPDIRNIDAVIGGSKKERRGIVLAKSMSAKKKGVKTADPLYLAFQKCPRLQVIPPNYEWYQQMSDQLFQLLSKYTPDIEIFSIDECFLDYTPIIHRYGNPLAFAYRLKEEIKKTLGFTVNIGIANNKLCAKMASDFEKPNRVHTLFQEEVKTKMYPLAIESLFGIGKKTAQKLRELNITTIGSLASANPTTLKRIFKNQAIKMIENAQGICQEDFIQKKEIPVCISNETTLEEDIVECNSSFPYLLELSEHVSLRLRKQKKYASTIAVTLKDNQFHRFSHQRKLDNPTDGTNEIYQIAKEIVSEMWRNVPIRLIGIRLDGLKEEKTRQLSLFENVDTLEKHTNLDQTIDQLKEKYGSKIIHIASNSNKLKKHLK